MKYHGLMGKMVGQLKKKNMLSEAGIKSMSRNPQQMMQHLASSMDPRIVRLLIKNR